MGVSLIYANGFFAHCVHVGFYSSWSFMSGIAKELHCLEACDWVGHSG